MDKESFREQIKYNKNETAEQIIQDVSEKYGYSQELSDLLLKIYYRVHSQESYEMQQNFFQTLQEVPIVIIDKITKETYEQLEDEYLGKDRVQTQQEESEYNSMLAPGAYVWTPVLDKSGKLVGEKSFIYIERLSPYFDGVIEKLGTDIHVPHLIHELGHAQAAREQQYTQQGNKITMRCGMMQTEHEVEFKDGNPILRETNSQGVYLEEALNTVLEYENVAKFLGVEASEVDNELYRGQGMHGLVRSNYHGLMDSIAAKLQKVMGKESIEQIRIFNNKKEEERCNKLLGKTKYWNESIHSPERMQKKEKAFNVPESRAWKQFCEKNRDTYFGSNEDESPLQKIDNVLRQIYDMQMAKYNISVDEYKEIALSVIEDAYYILNQADEIQKEDQKQI